IMELNTINPIHMAAGLSERSSTLSDIEMSGNWRSLFAAHDNILASQAVHTVIVEHCAHIGLCVSETLVITDHERPTGEPCIVECFARKGEISARCQMPCRACEKFIEFAHIWQNIGGNDQM